MYFYEVGGGAPQNTRGVFINILSFLKKHYFDFITKMVFNSLIPNSLQIKKNKGPKWPNLIIDPFLLHSPFYSLNTPKPMTLNEQNVSRAPLFSSRFQRYGTIVPNRFSTLVPYRGV